MPRFGLTFLVASLALLSHVAVATQDAVAAPLNDYPVILVHGFGGWGRKELLGFKYWGGNNNDYQQRLTNDYGLKNIMTAEIGPFSSNWDRACELYAQIKGGRVDYGANHAAKHGHQRYGRTFPGLFPQWGTVVNGKLQKVHLIGHSMGGQTIRMLTQLLDKGTAGAPIAEDPKSHPLFAGGNDWVHSVTAVSTPNQGTTIADGWASTVQKVESALIAWFGVGNLGGSSTFDAKLDQWGISPRKSGELVSSYVHRMFTSTFFAPTITDNSRTDLTTKGAKAINAWVKTLPNVYYYSISSQDTFSFINFSLKKVQLPNPLTMLLPLQPCATYLGSRATVDAGFSEDWMANDGQVNVPSQLSDGQGKVVQFSSASTRGAWNQYPTKNFCDHFAITGNSLYYDTADLFDSHIRVVRSLPAHESLKRRLTEGEFEVHQHTEAMVKNIADTHRMLEERGKYAAVRRCQENKDLTREQVAACGRFLEIMAPGTQMAPNRKLRGVN